MTNPSDMCVVSDRIWDAVVKFEVLGEGRQSGAPRRCEANSFGRKLDCVNIGHTTGERKHQKHRACEGIFRKMNSLFLQLAWLRLRAMSPRPRFGRLGIQQDTNLAFAFW